MTQDVRQWLTEIKGLQQKLEGLQQERDAAYASAANWRNLYETEAKQRRAETKLSQQAITSLNTQIQRLQELPVAEHTKADPLIEQEVAQLDISELKAALVQARVKCDRLSQALKAEKQAHAQTRKALTTALGDTVDLLNRERKSQPSTKAVTQVASQVEMALTQRKDANAEPQRVKTPSLELPPWE